MPFRHIENSFNAIMVCTHCGHYINQNHDHEWLHQPWDQRWCSLVPQTEYKDYTTWACP